jgi:hypothetical protein
MKNFGKYIVPITLESPISIPLKESIVAMKDGLIEMLPSNLGATGIKGLGTDVFSGVGEVIPALAAGYNVFDHISNVSTEKDAGQNVKNIIQAGLAPISLIPGFGLIAPAISVGLDVAEYMGDISEGRQDPPPIGDVQQRNNPIGTAYSRTVGSKGVGQFFRNFGNNWGISLR